MAGFINKKIEEIPKETFVNYFKWSMKDILQDLIQYKQPDKYGAIKDKIYAPPPVKQDKDDDYEYYQGRYIVKDKELWP